MIFGSRAGLDTNHRLGKASLADGGSLYLEGVEQLSPQTQRQLIDFLSDGAAQRAAGETPHPDVRVIASISQRSENDPSQRRLPEELEKALAQQRLAVPSLAERKADVAVIADHIVERSARSSGQGRGRTER